MVHMLVVKCGRFAELLALLIGSAFRRFSVIGDLLGDGFWIHVVGFFGVGWKRSGGVCWLGFCIWKV